MNELKRGSILFKDDNYFVVLNVVICGPSKILKVSSLVTPTETEFVHSLLIGEKYVLVEDDAERCPICKLPVVNGRCGCLNREITNIFCKVIGQSKQRRGFCFGDDIKFVFETVYGQTVDELIANFKEYAIKNLALRNEETVDHLLEVNGFESLKDCSTFRHNELTILECDKILDNKEKISFKEKAIEYYKKQFGFTHAQTIEFMDMSNTWLTTYIDVFLYRIDKSIVEKVIYNNPEIDTSVLIYTHQNGSKGIKKRNERRITHCYNCKESLDSEFMDICPNCGWIICPNCGACGCGYSKM